MTVTVPSLEQHLIGLKACLTAAASADDDRWAANVGVAPDNTEPPYADIHVPDGGRFNGTLADGEADLELPFQVTCVARDPLEAAWLRDRVVVALRTTPITVTGRAVMWIRSAGGPGAVRQDPTVRPPVFYCTPQFRLATTPA